MLLVSYHEICIVGVLSTGTDNIVSAIMLEENLANSHALEGRGAVLTISILATNAKIEWLMALWIYLFLISLLFYVKFETYHKHRFGNRQN